MYIQISLWKKVKIIQFSKIKLCHLMRQKPMMPYSAVNLRATRATLAESKENVVEDESSSEDDDRQINVLVPRSKSEVSQRKSRVEKRKASDVEPHEDSYDKERKKMKTKKCKKPISMEEM